MKKITRMIHFIFGDMIRRLMGWLECGICMMAYFEPQLSPYCWYPNSINSHGPIHKCMQRTLAPPPNTADYLRYSLEIGMNCLVAHRHPCDLYVDYRFASYKWTSKNRCKWISSFPNHPWNGIVAIRVLNVPLNDIPSKIQCIPVSTNLCCYFVAPNFHRPVNISPLHNAKYQIRFRSSSESDGFGALLIYKKLEYFFFIFLGFNHILETKLIHKKFWYWLKKHNSAFRIPQFHLIWHYHKWTAATSCHSQTLANFAHRCHKSFNKTIKYLLVTARQYFLLITWNLV